MISQERCMFAFGKQIGFLRSIAIGVVYILASSGCTSPVSHTSSAGTSYWSGVRNGARGRVQGEVRRDGVLKNTGTTSTIMAGQVAQSAEFRTATSKFSHHDISGALRNVNALLAQATLSDVDRTFLLHQRAICQTALSGKPASPGRLPVDLAHLSSSTDRKVVRAASAADCGPRALLLVCQRLGIPGSLPALRMAAGTTGAGTNLVGLIRAAESVHLQAEGVQMDGLALANLNTDKTPALAWVDGDHYVAVLSVHGDTATIHDPNRGVEENISLATGPTGLLERSGGILLLLSRQGNSPRTLAANTATGMLP